MTKNFLIQGYKYIHTYTHYAHTHQQNNCLAFKWHGMQGNNNVHTIRFRPPFIEIHLKVSEFLIFTRVHATTQQKHYRRGSVGVKCNFAMTYFFACSFNFKYFLYENVFKRNKKNWRVEFKKETETKKNRQK